MSIYDFINNERIKNCAKSTSDFIVLISDIETALLTIRALNVCGIPDEIDIDGLPSRTWDTIWIASNLGNACESDDIPDSLLSKYIPELILLGRSVDEHAWEYGFNNGVERAKDFYY